MTIFRILRLHSRTILQQVLSENSNCGVEPLATLGGAADQAGVGRAQVRTSFGVEELILAPDTLVLRFFEFLHYVSLTEGILKKLPAVRAGIVLLPPRLHAFETEQRHTHMAL
jgi:hypothetical protein